MLQRRHEFVALLVLIGALVLPLGFGNPHGAKALSPPTQREAQEPPPDPRFGMVEAFWDTAAAVEARVGWERILFQWSQLQPNGPDDWNTLHVPDEWLQWAQAQGREVVGLLKNTPSWATNADPPTEASPPRGLDLALDDPANTWAAFVRRTVAFYAARGVHRWIIWNEPDIPPGVYGQEWAGSVEDYFHLLKVAYLVIKEVDPAAQVHLAGLTFWHDRGWLRDFLAVATGDPEGPAHGFFFDVVSLHIYFQTDTVDYIVNEARAALTAFGIQKPIWINETNASPDADPLWPLERPRWRVDLTEQASFILQSYALGFAAGAERIGVYKLMDAGLPPGGEPFGLLRPDHSRRPAYTAYRLVTQYYAATRSARISRQTTFTQVTLDQGERTTRVFWARTEAPVSMTVPALSAQATLVDQDGNVQTLDASSGSYSLTLPGARCADEVSGCIIGGPTYLLVEAAPAGDVGAPDASAATPTLEASPDEPTPASPSADTPWPTDTLRPTSPGVTLVPTATGTPTPAPALSATPTLIPSPTHSPSPTEPLSTRPTASPSASATIGATPSRTPGVTPSLAPTSSPTGTASPISTKAPNNTPGLLVAGGVIALAILVGLFLWRATRR